MKLKLNHKIGLGLLVAGIAVGAVSVLFAGSVTSLLALIGIGLIVAGVMITFPYTPI